MRVFLFFPLVVVSVLLVQGLWAAQYDRENFNCVDMSYAIAPIFYSLGFPTEIVYGSNNGSSHCWVRVWGLDFEATCLWFRDNTGRYPSVDFVDRFPWGYWDELEAGG